MKTSYRTGRQLAAALFVAACLLFGPGAAAEAQDAAAIGRIYEKFNWRAIGPAVMGGRTVDIAVVESDPSTIYAATGPSATG